MKSIKSKFKFGITIAIILGIIFFFTNPVWAASAIAISKDSIKYAICSEKKSAKEAEECAISQCGVNCKIEKSCKETGYGAVYQNYLRDADKSQGVEKAITSASCGQEYPGEALGNAMATCKYFNRKSNSSLKLNRCYEKARYFDPSMETAKTETWCKFATDISGLKSFKDCLNSARYPNPKIDCPHHVRQWCRKIK